jgi:hypothetical protein
VQSRSLHPSAQRYCIATVRPSIQPSSRSRCTNAAVNWLCAAAVDAPSNPMVGSFAGSCARAPASGAGSSDWCQEATSRRVQPTSLR